MILADASPAELLAGLSEQHASGALAIERAARSMSGETAAASTATLHLRNGLVYAAALVGGTFLVGTRLVTSHALDADALAEALEAQRSDLSGWRLGEILVHLGHIHADVVEKISIEQVLEISTEVLSWREGSWKFRSGERTRAMLPHPLAVEDLLGRVQARSAEWRELLPTIGGRHAPVIRTAATVPLSSSRELMALLRATEEHQHPGGTGLEACSHAAGVSLLEGARLVVSARAAGLLTAPPMEERLAVGDWPREQPPVVPGPPANLTLAPTVEESTIELTSYALARLLELTGPAPARAPAPVAAPDPTLPDPTLPESPLPEPTLEEIVADLEPEVFEDTGHEATVLDLNAARVARSAELATLEEAATSAALREQLAREQADRDADERAVADALRLAVQSRAAATAPPAYPNSCRSTCRDHRDRRTRCRALRQHGRRPQTRPRRRAGRGGRPRVCRHPTQPGPTPARSRRPSMPMPPSRRSPDRPRSPLLPSRLRPRLRSRPPGRPRHRSPRVSAWVCSAPPATRSPTLLRCCANSRASATRTTIRRRTGR